MPTKSAFSQRRKDFMHGLFIEANNVLVRSLYDEDEGIRYWNGYRLIGVDGTRINLPNSTEIRNEFGMQTNPHGSSPMALLTSAHDVLNNITITSDLGSYKESELSQAKNIVDRLNDSRDLLIFDRGFGALWFMHMLLRKEKAFVIRVNTIFFPALNDLPDGSVIKEYNTIPRNAVKRFQKQNEPFSPFKIRFVTLTLPTGEREFLATTLLNRKRYPDSMFSELYAMRWGVETYYHHLKVHMDVENFSGKSAESIRQDLFAGIFVENLRVSVEIDVNEELRQKHRRKSTKYQYQVNRDVSFGILRDEIIDLTLTEPDIDRFYKKMKRLFVFVKIPIIEDRHIERGPKRLGNRRKFFMSGRKTT
jgi:hypothetical protein